MAQQLSDLQSFGIPNLLTFEQGPGKLLRAAIITPHAEATVYLQGAHVTHYRPVGQKPLLFMSQKTQLEPGKPIRGGIPICFPWFGPRAGDPSAPPHGFARILPWSVESTRLLPDKSVSLGLRLEPTDMTLRTWPAFSARCRITVGPWLDLALEVRNESGDAFVFEEALHAYFFVGDVRQASIIGLANTHYLDKTDGMKRKLQGAEPVAITAETDRVYLNTQSTCEIDDPVFARRIIIEKAGSDTTVVWNPWIAKAKVMPDFGDDEWQGMLCVESANALENAITLAPGRSHTLSVRYHSTPR